jgi:hypothetical protein
MSDINNSEDRNTYLASWFQRFKFIVLGSFASGSAMRQNSMEGRTWGRDYSPLVDRKQRKQYKMIPGQGISPKGMLLLTCFYQLSIIFYIPTKFQ